MAANGLRTFAIIPLLSVFFITGCGGGSNSSSNNEQVVISISPTTATLNGGAQQQFQATITGSSNTGVQWQVNNIAGGNAQFGTITAAGLYTAPNPGDLSIQVTVTAIASANPAKTAGAQVTVNPIIA